MTDDDKIILCRAIVDKGGAVIDHVLTVGGVRSVDVAPSDLPLFLGNHRAWIAKA